MVSEEVGDVLAMITLLEEACLVDLERANKKRLARELKHRGMINGKMDKRK